MRKIGVFYGSSTGNTEMAAQKIAAAFGTGVEIFNVVDVVAGDMEQYDNIILGASTWGNGSVQSDFGAFLDDLRAMDLTGKKIAIFGFGDQQKYPDTFVDGIGEIYKLLIEKKCEIVGKITTDSFDYNQSKAVIDGKFVGLPLDEENQSNLTDDRIAKWTEQLRHEFN